MPTRLGLRLRGRLLLGASLSGGRLRDVHRRLDRRGVVLLLPHVGLGSSVREFHSLIAAVHVCLVRVVAARTVGSVRHARARREDVMVSKAATPAQTETVAGWAAEGILESRSVKAKDGEERGR